MALRNKSELVAFLKETLAAIEEDDSFEGSIQYHVSGRNAEGETSFEVGAFVRVGNSMGQGGCMLIEAEKDPNKPKMLHIVMHEMGRELPTENHKIYYVVVNGSLVKCQWNNGWIDPHGERFPEEIQKKFTYWANPDEFVME